jgi:RimJ/RimL family protein N-acetyltransferase
MTIRKTKMEDLPEVMQIYSDARAFMRETGNADQWGGSHPPQELIEKDIQNGCSYVCLKDGEITAVFYFNIEEDPTYSKIDGSWLNNGPYGVVHRIARAAAANAKGSGAFCLDWCFARHPNIRIDTHKDNGPMIALLERLGFKCCGIIWLIGGSADGDERMAFQKIL